MCAACICRSCAGRRGRPLRRAACPAAAVRCRGRRAGRFATGAHLLPALPVANAAVIGAEAHFIGRTLRRGASDAPFADHGRGVSGLRCVEETDGGY